MRGRILAGGVVSLVLLGGCGAAGAPRTSATLGATSAASTPASAVPAPATSARTTAAATPRASTVTVAGVRLTLDDLDAEGVVRVLTVSRSCSGAGAVQVRFKAGALGRRQVRLVMVDESGRVLRSSARWLSLTDRAPGGDGGVPFYGVRDTWVLRQVAGAALGTGTSAGWRLVLVTADSRRALAPAAGVVVPSCGDAVWHAPSPTLEVTDVRRHCTAEAAAGGSFTARVRVGGLVAGQVYAVDGGASGHDLNTVPRTRAETYDGDMTFAPGIDRRPTANGVAAPFPRTAFTVSVRVGPDRVVRSAIAMQAPTWFETRDETSEPVTIAVPGC
ncbi:MAG: hypothetical protein ACTHN8_09920 [Angustibacter sp.]